MTEDENDNKDEDEEEIKHFTRSICVHNLNQSVEMTSDDPDDTLNKMKKMIEVILDKYK